MDKYNIIKLLGEGAQGQVYLAEDPQRIEVVLKIFNNNEYRSDEREIFITKELHRKTVYGQSLYIEDFEINGHKILVTRFFRGFVPLNQIFSSDRNFFTDERIVDLASDLLNNLRSIHDARIYHRDIKTENIIVSKALLKGKFIDFGLSCDDDSDTWKCGGVIGSLPYVYPGLFLIFESGEEILEEDYETADYYSLLSVIYELVVGKTPNDYYLDDVPISENRAEERTNQIKAIKRMAQGNSPIRHEVLENPEWVSFVEKFPYFKTLEEAYFNMPILAGTSVD